MSEIVMEVLELKKSYKGNHVLKNVTFTVEKGSIFALLGSNGAGKTTLIKILTTLLKPDGGSAVIKGFHVTTQADKVRECIGLTGQFVAIDEALTGRENIWLMGQLNRLPNLKNQVEQWLSFSNLEEAASAKVSTYSGGMRRRLDIAMSLMGSPHVLFLDEPTTGLDPQNRIAMWDLVKDLAKKGTTVFLTTQYLEEAEYLADHIAILHKGTIIADGTPTYLREIMPKRGMRLHFDTEANANMAVKCLGEHGIFPQSIEENFPSLEEVFFTLIDEKNEKMEGHTYEKNQ